MQATRKIWPIGLAASTGVAVLALVLLLSKPATPADVANGLFAHDCCGTLSLRDGRMILNQTKAVRYKIARDKAGLYIIPETYVGPFEYKGFEVDGARPPIKLRLDHLSRPQSIVLIEGRTSFVFKRKEFHPRFAKTF
jgi:hypothetical protein